MFVFFIMLGVFLVFYASIKLIKFFYDLSQKINEINELYSSENFLLHKELKQSIDELNYSYYEILEKQDDRITNLESKINDNISFGKKKYIDNFESKQELDEKIKLNDKITSMYKEGISKEQIAFELNVGKGIVDLVCSVYSK